jgi:Zn-dependent protease with chaperone function
MQTYPRSAAPAPAALPIPMPPPQPLAKHAGAQVMPSFTFPSGSVTPSEHVAASTSLYTMLGYAAVAVGVIVAAASSMGMALLLIPIALIVQHFQAKSVRALIRGSGVQVSPVQLPQLYAVIEQFSQRLGLKEVPEVYIVEESMQNGFAVKLGKRDIVLLTDDVVWGALQSRDPHALGFVVGHELGHIAMGHTGLVRSMLRTAFKPLSRADELSCDNVASALVGNPDIAVHGVMLLTVGPQLLSYINDAALLAQAQQVCADKLSKKAERKLTHPLLLRRIGNLKHYS